MRGIEKHFGIRKTKRITDGEMSRKSASAKSKTIGNGLIQRASQLYANGNLDQALGVLKNAAKLIPHDHRVYYIAALIQEEKGNNEKALNGFFAAGLTAGRKNTKFIWDRVYALSKQENDLNKLYLSIGKLSNGKSSEEALLQKLEILKAKNMKYKIICCEIELFEFQGIDETIFERISAINHVSSMKHISKRLAKTIQKNKKAHNDYFIRNTIVSLYKGKEFKSIISIYKDYYIPVAEEIDSVIKLINFISSLKILLENSKKESSNLCNENLKDKLCKDEREENDSSEQLSNEENDSNEKLNEEKYDLSDNHIFKILGDSESQYRNILEDCKIFQSKEAEKYIKDLIFLYKSINALSSAIEICKSSLIFLPNIEKRILYGDLLFQNGKAIESIKIFTDILYDDPTNLIPKARLYEIYKSIGNDAAASEFKSPSDLLSNNKKVENKSNFRWSSDKCKEIREKFDKANEFLFLNSSDFQNNDFIHISSDSINISYSKNYSTDINHNEIKKTSSTKEHFLNDSESKIPYHELVEELLEDFFSNPFITVTDDRFRSFFNRHENPKTVELKNESIPNSKSIPNSESNLNLESITNIESIANLESITNPESTSNKTHTVESALKIPMSKIDKEHAKKLVRISSLHGLDVDEWYFLIIQSINSMMIFGEYYNCSVLILKATRIFLFREPCYLMQIYLLGIKLSAINVDLDLLCNLIKSMNQTINYSATNLMNFMLNFFFDFEKNKVFNSVSKNIQRIQHKILMNDNKNDIIKDDNKNDIIKDVNKNECLNDIKDDNIKDVNKSDIIKNDIKDDIIKNDIKNPQSSVLNDNNRINQFIPRPLFSSTIEELYKYFKGDNFITGIILGAISIGHTRCRVILDKEKYAKIGFKYLKNLPECDICEYFENNREDDIGNHNNYNNNYKYFYEIKNYNIAKAYHFLGYYAFAERHYLLVLDSEDSNLRRMAIFNLSLIFKKNKSTVLLKHIFSKW